MILNLKSLNRFVESIHFKMETVNLLKDLVRQGDYFVKLDLKDAYYSVAIREDQQRFL